MAGGNWETALLGPWLEMHPWKEKLCDRAGTSLRDCGLWSTRSRAETPPEGPSLGDPCQGKGKMSKTHGLAERNRYVPTSASCTAHRIPEETGSDCVGCLAETGEVGTRKGGSGV